MTRKQHCCLFQDTIPRYDVRSAKLMLLTTDPNRWRTLILQKRS